MPKKNFSFNDDEKKALGSIISELRKKQNVSLRKFAEYIGVAPSNLTYIERGVNAPTSEVYEMIIKGLNVSDKERAAMDRLYVKIRKIPPPDVCKVLINNMELMEKIKLFEGFKLSKEQIKNIGDLFCKQVAKSLDYEWLKIKQRG